MSRESPVGERPIIPTISFPIGPYVLKIADIRNRLAIEVGHPRDFFIEMDMTQIEWTSWNIVRHQLLRTAGWRVIKIPFFEWEELPDRLSKARYLQHKLIRATQDRSPTTNSDWTDQGTNNEKSISDQAFIIMKLGNFIACRTSRSISERAGFFLK